MRSIAAEVREIRKAQKKIEDICARWRRMANIKIGYPKSVVGGSAGRYPGNSTYGSFRTPPNVIEVAFWNNYGTKTIPARPFFSTASKEMAEKSKPMIRRAIEDINDNVINGGDVKGDMEYALGRIGSLGVSIIKKNIRDWKIPPNSHITVYGGWMYNKEKGKSFYVKGKRKHVNNPLVDTGWLQKCVSWEIVEDKDGVTI